MINDEADRVIEELFESSLIDIKMIYKNQWKAANLSLEMLSIGCNSCV